MIFSQLNEETKRSICKKEIENLENWLRRLVHESLSKEYGSNYLEYKDKNNNYLIKTEIRERVKSLIEQESERFPRSIDAFFLPDLIYIICKEDLYNKLFKILFVKAFPEGRNEARTFLLRLEFPRNALSHANPISDRQAEQVICYCHDIIDSLQEYYFEMGTEHEYNVPRIIKITDSLGNTIHFNEIEKLLGRIWYLDKDRKNYLRPGDTLGIEIEIDPSFSPSSYTIEWKIKHRTINEYNNKTKISFDVEAQHVGTMFSVECSLISNKTWHKYGDWDDDIGIIYKVLPPLNDH
jgi:hypothetical protein